MKNQYEPPKFTDAEIQHAVDLVKSSSPDLWERLTEHEKKDEGYGHKDADDLRQSIEGAPGTESVLKRAFLMREVRRRVRMEAGLQL